MKFVRLFVAGSAVALPPAANGAEMGSPWSCEPGIYTPQDVDLPGSDLRPPSKFQSDAAFGVLGSART